MDPQRTSPSDGNIREIMRTPMMVPAGTLGLLATVLLVETIIMGAVVGFYLVELFSVPSANLMSSIALFVLLVIGLVLLAITTRGAFRRSSWVRGAAITWQVLLLAAAYLFATGNIVSWLGWVVGVLCILGIVFAVLPSTARALNRGE
ncbi:hypothetical protein M3D15_01070 [Pseudoclavibacter alba]|uniref:Integral membrane protein n=1 Tax=Pseudoclavibacter albus TaxID=272241 RepID=A0ABT2HUD6_9MICO|nr:hypothetical protein [Pseudoclavibacter alba]MCT2041937.1 hypothetical protein [Pseudoclavibacter alba]